MKKYQLLLLILLLTPNKLLITQNSENIHSTSIKNIKKPSDESSRVEKHNPATHPNPASSKNIEKPEHQKSSSTSKIQEITTEVMKRSVRNEVFFHILEKVLGRSPIAFQVTAVIWNINDSYKSYKTILEDSEKYSIKESFIKMTI